MRAGKLDRRITIQRRSATASESGDPVETWETIVNRRAASWAPIPVREAERFIAPQIVAQNHVEFRVRYSSDIAVLLETGPLYRIIYPALGTDSPEDEPTVSQIHDIQQVNEIGRREGLQIIALRRADVAPAT